MSEPGLPPRAYAEPVLILHQYIDTQAQYPDAVHPLTIAIMIRKFDVTPTPLVVLWYDIKDGMLQTWFPQAILTHYLSYSSSQVALSPLFFRLVIRSTKSCFLFKSNLTSEMQFAAVFVTLYLSILATAIPFDRRAAFTKQNGIDAQQLAASFASLTPDSPCQSGQNACVEGQFAQCDNGKFVLTPCAGGLTCQVLPLVNSAGTSITCDTATDDATRVANTGARREIKARDSNPTAPPACAALSKRDSFMTIAKRIAQTDLPAVAQSWQNLCQQSGGDIVTNSPCVTLAGQNGISSLLANADPCAQQDNADAMIDFAKSPGVTNKQALIDNAVAYRQHPRNALNVNGITPSTPFCQKAPTNPELNGVVNGQLDGVDPGVFGTAGNIFAFGGAGSCPFGKTADVSTCKCN